MCLRLTLQIHKLFVLNWRHTHTYKHTHNSQIQRQNDDDDATAMQHHSTKHHDAIFYLQLKKKQNSEQNAGREMKNNSKKRELDSHSTRLSHSLSHSFRSSWDFHICICKCIYPTEIELMLQF